MVRDRVPAHLVSEDEGRSGLMGKHRTLLSLAKIRQSNPADKQASSLLRVRNRPFTFTTTNSGKEMHITFLQPDLDRKRITRQSSAAEMSNCQAMM